MNKNITKEEGEFIQMVEKYSNEQIESFIKGLLKLKIRGKPKEEFRQIILNGVCYHYLISSYGRLISTQYR